MTPVDMSELHDADTGAIGDCLRATVATLLDLPSDDVPHFVRLGIDNGDCPGPCDEDHEHGWGWWEKLLDFLWGRGMVLAHLTVPPPRPHLASGMGPRGNHHVVAVDADGTIHDPHPSRAGLLDVDWRAEFVHAYELDGGAA